MCAYFRCCSVCVVIHVGDEPNVLLSSCLTMVVELNWN